MNREKASAMVGVTAVGLIIIIFAILAIFTLTSCTPRSTTAFYIGEHNCPNHLHIDYCHNVTSEQYVKDYLGVDPKELN